jgi:hypothetical protein
MNIAWMPAGQVQGLSKLWSEVHLAYLSGLQLPAGLSIKGNDSLQRD